FFARSRHRGEQYRFRPGGTTSPHIGQSVAAVIVMPLHRSPGIARVASVPPGTYWCQRCVGLLLLSLLRFVVVSWSRGAVLWGSSGCLIWSHRGLVLRCRC